MIKPNYTTWSDEDLIDEALRLFYSSGGPAASQRAHHPTAQHSRVQRGERIVIVLCEPGSECARYLVSESDTRLMPLMNQVAPISYRARIGGHQIIVRRNGNDWSVVAPSNPAEVRLHTDASLIALVQQHIAHHPPEPSVQRFELMSDGRDLMIVELGEIQP